MSFIGHVYPAIFYMVVGGLMLGQFAHSLGSGKDPLYATNGGSWYLRRFGLLVMTVTMTGIIVEGAGGALTKGDLFFQAAHQSIHVAFCAAGIVTVLESFKRAPFDSSRLFMSLAFFVEALTFYGHQLEQEMPESTLHLVTAGFSLVTSATFFASVFSPRSLIFQAMNIVGVLMQGIWLMWIAYIIYTEAFGRSGRDFMIADIYMTAGLWVLFTSLFVGFFFLKRSSDVEGDFSFSGFDESKYVPVEASKYEGV